MTYFVCNCCIRLAELDDRHQELRAMPLQHLLLSSDSEDATRHSALAQVSNPVKVGGTSTHQRASQLSKALHYYI